MSAPEFSDTALALELAEQHGNNFRFVKNTGQVLHWDGAIWREDIAACSLSHVASTINCAAAVRTKDEKLARSVASRRAQQAVVSLIKTDPRIIVESKQLDSNPVLLGTPAGIIDLRTGEMLPAAREHLVTMSTSVVPAEPGTPCPMWDTFLSTTFPLVPGQPEPDDETISFIQRLAGYSATGLNNKHHFVFCLGRGRNGKGLLMNPLHNVLGDYACTLSSDSLTERPTQPHRQEFAGLRGKRFVTSSEISAGKHWDEAILNQLSGGDVIRANFMRQNSFEFYSVAKLWIRANNMPVFRSVDIHLTERLILMWMRMHFLESVKGHENESNVVQQDDQFDNKLKVEYPAILRWIIDGAGMALSDGLNIPNSVRLSGRSYLESEDALGTFISVNCLFTQRWGPLRELWEMWNLCRKEDGEKPHTMLEFRKLIEVRYKVEHQNFGNAVYGIALNDMARAKLLRAREANEASQQDTRRERERG